MLIYFILIPLIWLFSVQAEKHDKFKYLSVIVVILTVIAGFRSESVGIDTKNYVLKIAYIANGNPEFAYGFETGFKLLIKYILKINNSYTFFFTLVAAVTNYLIIRRLWDFRHIASVPCMMLCYYASFYGYTFNIVRQFLAIAIIFFSSRLLEKRKYVPFALIVLLCTFFVHQSSIICIGFIAADMFMWKNLTKWQKNLIGMGLIIVPIAFSYVAGRLLAKYVGYFETTTNNMGFMILAKVLFFVISLYVSRYILIPKLSPDQIDSNYQEYRMRKATTIYYPIGLLLTVIGYFYPFMDRIGLYYMFFECIYFGMLLKVNLKNSVVYISNYTEKIVKDNSLVYLLLILLLVGYNFFTDIFNNAQGIVPYISNLF